MRLLWLVPVLAMVTGCKKDPVELSPVELSNAIDLNKDVPKHSLEYLSPVYEVTDMYRSMKGPQTTAPLTISDANPPELLWVTGYRAVMVDEEGTTPVSQEFMCHSNLNWDFKAHRKLFGWKKTASNRLFTLSQGQQNIAFPEGFGIPVLSNEELKLNTQVLNLNWKGAVRKVRHKVHIDYVRGADLKAPMTALFMTAANALVSLDDRGGDFNIPKGHESAHEESCLPGQSAHADGRVWEDNFGQKFSGHWLVPPGRQVGHTNVTEYLSVPFDTKAHYIAVHLHPFAESLVLRDLTTDSAVFTSKVRNSADRIGLDQVDYYSNAEGLPIFAEHDYELVTTYNNTSGEDQDSMAVMFLYLQDQEYTLAN